MVAQFTMGERAPCNTQSRRYLYYNYYFSCKEREKKTKGNLCIFTYSEAQKPNLLETNITETKTKRHSQLHFVSSPN